MREILFRGRTTKDKEWVYGDLLHDGYDYDVAIWEKEYKLVTDVSPETIGQFTGLTDKNGKKIFEGDVVLYPWNDQDKPERFTIKFKDGQFVASPVKETEDYWDFMVGGYSKEMEIIGNIHDNPNC